jgi:hypothetical protein
MKTKKLFTLLLLLSMSFQVVHAYAIDMLDTHESSLHEYIQEFSQTINENASDDLCKIHFEFHSPFILPQNQIFLQENNHVQKPFVLQNLYEFTAYENSIKPPINL